MSVEQAAGSLWSLSVSEENQIKIVQVHLRLTPYTLHPTPYTLHHTPYTLHPTPYTRGFGC